MKTPLAVTALMLLGACAQPTKVTAPDPQAQSNQQPHGVQETGGLPRV